MAHLTEIFGLPMDRSVSGRWIFERIEDLANKEPRRPAFVLDLGGDTEEHSYLEVLQSSNRIAARLEAIGVERGDRVGVLMENVPEWVLAMLGILRIGSIVVPLATALPESSLRRICSHAGCRVVITDPANEKKARDTGATVMLLPLEKASSSAPAGPTILRLPGDTETALIIYTSGTTGDPKGVELTLSSLAHEIRGVSENFELSSNHRILSVLPFSHILPLVANGVGALCIGATVVFLSSISPQRIVEAFRKHRITLFVCVPQFFYALHKKIFAQVKAQRFLTRQAFRVMFAIAGKLRNAALRRKLFGSIHRAIGPDLRVLASGGSRFEPAVALDLERLGYTLLQAYGLTETSAAAAATSPSANVIGSVGRPIRGVGIRIDSPGADGVGEVCIRGPILMKGYYREPAATERAIKDGWFYSGDLGRIDAAGNLIITGRSKDVIVLANGENVYPEELEAHYGASQWIKEMCIMSIGGAGSERLHAVVVPDMEEFRARGQSTISENIQFDLETSSKQLPSYYRLLSFSIRHEPLPRTVTRKLRRFEIQQEERDRRDAETRKQIKSEHSRFKEGAGAAVAQLVRQAKPDAGPLDVDMNLELDLGFDSLARVELLGLAEAQLGVRIDEERAARIYTLGELLDALAAASRESGRGTSWKEILDVAPGDELHRQEVFEPTAFTLWSSYLIIRLARLFFRLYLPLHFSGLERLPHKTPFILCPNHQSFLDGPLLISVLPKDIIDRIFILGYTDYFQGSMMRFFGKLSRIVAIDPNVNLVQALRIGAVGLRRGMVLLVFPEGIRTFDGKLTDFKKGAAILAVELGVPVVPVGLKGAFEMWPRGGRFRRHPVHVAFGDPIDPMNFRDSADPYASLTEALKQTVESLV